MAKQGGQKAVYAEIVPLKAGASRQSVFTYHSSKPLSAGQLVTVPFGKLFSLGLALKTVTKPPFTTKPIIKTHAVRLPAYFLQLGQWLSAYYAAPLAKTFTTMLPAGLSAKPRQTSPDTQSPSKHQKASTVTLLAQQTAALSSIKRGSHRSYLLHGITGSGKTQVYIELAKAAFNGGESTIILVPEISLTPQITEQFKHHFGNDVLLTHSGLTAAQRRNIWLEALNTKQPKVVVGPRSALFSPLSQLGYVIVDEAHETSYKQEQAPRYQTTAVAAQLAYLASAKLVLGTATPSVYDTFLAKEGRLKTVKMPRRVYKNRIQSPIIVDLSKKASKPPSPFVSKPLFKALEATLGRKKQAILFMNRRGTARLALCNNCQWVAICPNCHIPLTFHADKGQLVCHWCEHHQAPPARCSECGHLEIRFLGGGTKRVEAEVSRLFPHAKLARLDKDSLDPATVRQLFEQINGGEIDILIGTQMVAKGLDIPNVETIGIMLADTMLYLPDYTATERTFQLLYQVAGRAGRREGTDANVVIQTYSPSHPAIQAAARGDYEGFIKNELAERKLLNYPPFVYLLKLSLSRASRKSAQSVADALAVKLHKITGVEVVGPAPAWRETLRGTYHWQIIVKSKVRSRLVGIANNLPAGWTHDLDPINLL